MFNPNIEKYKEGIKTSMRDNGFVILESAFLPEVAENLYRELTESDAWSHKVIEENIDTPQYFKYSREQIKFDSGKEPPALLALKNFLRGNECRNLVAELSGLACMNFEGAAARMGPEDSIDVHYDHNSTKRTVAFILYPNKN